MGLGVKNGSRFGGIMVALAIAATVVGLGIYGKSAGWFDEMMKQAEEEKAVAKAVKEQGLPTVTDCVNVWGGYSGCIYYNGGMEANASSSSRFYQDGVIVNFLVFDNPKLIRDAWKAGQCDVLDFVTADSLPPEINELAAEGGLIFKQVDWSEGGDVIVVGYGINTVSDLRGQTIAVGIGTPSHTLLLLTLAANGMTSEDVQIIGVTDGIEAAKTYKAGAAKAAVVYSPDDQDCIKNVQGTKVLVDTTKANRVIADVSMYKKSVRDQKREALVKFTRGCLKAAGEINTNAAAREKAAQLLSTGFNLNDIDLARLMIKNAHLSTYGDNQSFFGMKTVPGVVRGEEVYNKMHRFYREVSLAPVQIPLWRNIVDTSILTAITDLNTPADGMEAAPVFAPPTPEEVKAPAFAEKKVSVTFAFGSAVLTDDGKTEIDVFVSNMAKEFGKARFRIEGNTDDVGKYDVNKKLSLDRARAGVQYLVAKHGFDPNRFIVAGNGPDKPTEGCKGVRTEECRQKNRRTTFSIIQ